MHEVDPEYSGLGASVMRWEDVNRWRKAERARQIASRLALTPEQRRAYGERIAVHLKDLIGDLEGLVVSAYWPIRGEPDLRPFMETLASAGVQTALPVAIELGRPLVFRLWKKGDRLEKGLWKIPVPADGAEVVPDVVTAPVVGFDRQMYRLGYGGGFFDRTLAALAKRPRVFGVGYSSACLPTIYPQAHDIPMDFIVTERETVGIQAGE